MVNQILSEAFQGQLSTQPQGLCSLRLESADPLSVEMDEDSVEFIARYLFVEIGIFLGEVFKYTENLNQKRKRATHILLSVLYLQYFAFLSSHGK